MGATVEFCGEEFVAADDRPLTIGRVADVEIDDNPYLHRVFLQLHREHELWWLSNVGSTLTATVADKKGLFQAWLSPGARIPLALEAFTVWFTAGPTTYDFDIVLTDTPFVSVETAAELEPEDAGAETTVGRVSMTPDQKLLVVALCEGFLRSSYAGAGQIPSLGRRRRAARLDGHQVQPQARQRLPEAGGCRHPRPARRPRQAREQPQGAPRRARPVDPDGHRERPRPPRLAAGASAPRTGSPPHRSRQLAQLGWPSGQGDDRQVTRPAPGRGRVSWRVSWQVGDRRGEGAVGRARRRTASTLAVVLVASGLGYVAVASQGSTVHEAALNDSGVWVSSDTQAKFARANVPIGQLDTGVATNVAAGSGLDVLQDGAAVVGVGTGAGQLFPIDPRTSTAGDPAATLATEPPKPGTFTATPVDLRGGTIALLDRESGKIWAQRVDPAFRHHGARRTVGVGQAASRRSARPVRSRSTGPAPSTRSPAPTARSPRCRCSARSSAQPTVTPTKLRSEHPDLTAVGTTWVAYDAAKDRVYTASEPRRVRRAGDHPRRPALRRPAAARPGCRHGGRRRPRAGGARAARRWRLPGRRRRAASGSTGCPAAPWSPARSCSAAACTPRGPRRAGSSTARTAGAPATSPPPRCRPRARRRPATAWPSGSTAAWSCSTTSTTAASGTSTTSRPRSTTGTPWCPRPAPTTRTPRRTRTSSTRPASTSRRRPSPTSSPCGPGRTSKLHVLDNDTDVAGSVLVDRPGRRHPPDHGRASRRRSPATARPSTSACPDEDRRRRRSPSATGSTTARSRARARPR